MNQQPSALTAPHLSLEDLGLQGFVELMDGLRSGLVILDGELRCVAANAAADRLIVSDKPLRGTRFTEHFSLCERDPMRQRLCAADAEEGCWQARLESMPRTLKGHRFPLKQAAADLVAIEFWDDTEPIRMMREVAALTTVADSMAYTGSLDDSMNALAASVRAATACEACTVVLVQPAAPTPPGRGALAAEGSLRVAGASGSPPGYVEAIAEIWSQGGPSLVNEALRTNKPLVLRDVHNSLMQDARLSAMHAFYKQVTWDVIVSVPLNYRGRPLGTVNCYFLPSRDPSPSDLRFLKAIADQAAVAVENARLLRELQGKAALEERQRLARELHDSVSQALYGVALGARTARELADRDPSAVKEPLDYVLQLAEAGLAEMRALIFELRPESLETEGLVRAIDKQVAALQARHHVQARTILCSEPGVSLSSKQELYRLVQEALHNTVKHARATQVEVKLQRRRGRLLLTVSDNGVGFDSNAEFPGHLGLKSMLERAAQLGGTGSVKSKPGRGTRVRIDIPEPG